MVNRTVTEKPNSDEPVTVEQGKGDQDFPARLSSALGSRSGTWLSKQLGASASTVNGWLRGSNEPGLTNLVSAADVLGVSVQWLATGQGSPSGAPQPIVPPDEGHQRPAPAEPPLDKWLFSRAIDGIRRVYRRVGGQIPTVNEVELGIEMHNRIVALAEGQEARHGALLMALDQLERDLQEARSSKHGETDQRTA